jgi:hypothetical protein
MKSPHLWSSSRGTCPISGSDARSGASFFSEELACPIETSSSCACAFYFMQ